MAPFFEQAAAPCGPATRNDLLGAMAGTAESADCDSPSAVFAEAARSGENSQGYVYGLDRTITVDVKGAVTVTLFFLPDASMNLMSAATARGGRRPHRRSG